ncbi:hypothetical protein [Streptomyces evansiae]|uniref:hypothetical protein n=1 Tax=Streptomyces evansiae TaxID=3075535 RepID=UPI002884859A|nr:hypothetical protein [Streptomyces sp. DSM 41859]MDT0425710.1 hypothetical protein [Streptomyces sp. DSM 41859]
MTLVPPPFMWGCTSCLLLYAGVLREARVGDGAVRAQLALAAHLVDDHPDDVPPPHAEGCHVCPGYASAAEPAEVARLWAEHRVREYFLPERAARRW